MDNYIVLIIVNLIVNVLLIVNVDKFMSRIKKVVNVLVIQLN
jgi:hypothetical protein